MHFVKQLAVLLSLALVLSLAACGPATPPEETELPPDSSAPEVSEPPAPSQSSSESTVPTESETAEPSEPVSSAPAEAQPTEPVSTEPAPTEAPPTEAAPVASGTLLTGFYGSPDPASFRNHEEITLEAEGEHIVLYTDGLLLNFTLRAGVMDPETALFTPTETLYTAPVLASDTLVSVHTIFGDVMPHLQVEFTGGDGTFTRYLFQSGEDGSILLIEP